MVIVLMMSAKMATLGVIKINLFWSKAYDVIVSVDDVNKKFLSSDSNYFVDVVISPKFGNSSISRTKVIIASRD